MSSWKDITNDTNFLTFEDPITGSDVPKEIYYQTYQSFLDTLDGKTEEDRIDFFFCRSPVFYGAWRFKDDLAQEYFTCGCEDLGLLLDYNTICAGESKEEKEERDKNKMIEQIQKNTKEKKKEVKNTLFKKFEQQKKSLEELKVKLKDPNLNEEKKKLLNIKVDKIIKDMEKSI